MACRSELGIDDWSKTELLIQKNVPMNVAWAFGDGDQRFPRNALLKLGWPEKDVDWLENTSSYARDKQFDADGYSLADAPIKHCDLHRSDDGGMSCVSWKSTIAEFIGEWRMESFRNARQLAADNCLRIICTFS